MDSQKSQNFLAGAASGIFDLPVNLTRPNAKSVVDYSPLDDNGRPLITEWIFKVVPVATARELAAAGMIWGVQGLVESGHAASTNEEDLAAVDQSPIINARNNQPFPIPVYGKCYQVHGQWARGKIFRNSSSTPPLALRVAAYIIQGRAVERQADPFVAVASPGNFNAIAPIMLMATKVQVLVDGGALVGDTITFRSAPGVAQSVIAGVLAQAQPVPLPINASFVEYTSTAGGSVQVTFLFTLFS